MEKYIPLLLGFILTTVCGGFLGHWLQNRTWKHQRDSQLLQNERATATALFESVSQLMDKRLYRMRLLAWSLEGESKDEKEIEQYLQDYRQVLYTWNDTLIRNLAITQAYFGSKVREQLEGRIYEGFSRVGHLIEGQYRTYKSGAPLSVMTTIELELRKLSDQIYELNFQMISLIQIGKIGIFAYKELSNNKAPEI